MNNNNVISPFNPHTLDAVWKLQKIILDTPDFEGVVDRVVNSILVELGYLQLGYRIIVLTLVDKKKQTLKRIALSQTIEAQKALEASPVPFQQIEIPLIAEDNFLIRALKEKKVYITHVWPDIFRPVLSDEAALNNQNAAGIRTSMIYPLVVKEEAIGVMIFSMIKNEEEVSDEEKALIARFTDIVGLAVQNARLYSSLKETAEDLKKANERLVVLDQLKDEFVSLASHELRTPMTAIKSYLWMALAGKGGDLNEKQKYYIDRSYISVERLIRLVNDMLNVSRIDSGRVTLEPAAVTLEKLVADVITDVTPRAQELSIAVKINQPTSPLPQVLADPDKIKEVLFNLIGNSLKFTPKDGAVTVSFKQNGDMIETTVADTGTGLAADAIPQLFQKFSMVAESYAADTPIQGTGLGLYICKSIVELHKGKIWVISEGPGKGSQFIFSLPVFHEGDLQKLQAASGGEAKEKVEIVHTGI